VTLFYFECGVIGWLALGFAMWVARLALNAMFECGLRTDRPVRDILCGLVSSYLILAELQKDLDGSGPLTTDEATLLEQPPT